MPMFDLDVQINIVRYKCCAIFNEKQEGSSELSKEEGTIIKESPPKPAMLFQQLHNKLEFHNKYWVGGSLMGGSGWQWDLASHWDSEAIGD